MQTAGVLTVNTARLSGNSLEHLNRNQVLLTLLRALTTICQKDKNIILISDQCIPWVGGWVGSLPCPHR